MDAQVITKQREIAFQEHGRWRCDPYEGYMLSYVAYYRKKLGITQSDLCKALGIFTPSGQPAQKVISSLETGEYDATEEFVKAIMPILGTAKEQITFPERRVGLNPNSPNGENRPRPYYEVPYLTAVIREKGTSLGYLASLLCISVDRLLDIANGQAYATPNQIQILAEQLKVEPGDLLYPPAREEEPDVVEVMGTEARLTAIEAGIREIRGMLRELIER